MVCKNLEEIKQRERMASYRKRRAEEKTQQSQKRLRFSLMLCLFLFLVAAGMGVISMTGSHPNIINYENKIINKYETWEMDLEKREEELKKQQKELGITPEKVSQIQHIFMLFFNQFMIRAAESVVSLNESVGMKGV